MHKIHISKDFKVSELKVKSRAMGVSLNDVFMGAVVKAVAEVSAHTKETKVVAFMPYSLYVGDQNLEKFVPGNRLCAIPVLHNFQDTLDEQIKESRRISNTLRDGRVGFGVKTMGTTASALMPNFLMKMGTDKEFKECQSMTCSNIAGAMAHTWSFDGKKALWCAAGTGAEHPVITLVSLFDTVKVTIISRPGIFSNTEELMAKIEENLSQAK